MEQPRANPLPHSPPTFSPPCHPVRASSMPYQYAVKPGCRFQLLSVLNLVATPTLQNNRRTGRSSTAHGKEAGSRHQGAERGPCESQWGAARPSSRAEDMAGALRKVRGAQTWRDWVQAGCQEQEASRGRSLRSWASSVTRAPGTRSLVLTWSSLKTVHMQPLVKNGPKCLPCG